MRVVDRVVLHNVRHRADGRLARSVMCLRVRGRRSGRWHELPVQYAVDGDDLVVLPGHPESKQWWRNLRGGAVVGVLINGARHDGRGRVMWADDPAYPRSVLAYRHRFPRASVPLDAPFVRIELEPMP